MKFPRHPLTPHAAHVLAARLRERGIYYSGRDVFHWDARTTRSVQLYLDHIGGGAGWRTFRDWMGNDLPPPSQHSWPDSSAQGRGRLDGADRVDRAGKR
jgi:hypothetical protein